MRFSFAFTSLFVGTATAAVAVKTDADVDIAVRDLVDADVDVDVDVKAFRRSVKSFQCPAGMSYCPWTKSCACQPGLKLDLGSKTCVGEPIHGAWPKPDVNVYAAHGVHLDVFCAISPYRIVKYNPKHKYCQAGLNTIAFVASANVGLEIAALVDVDIDINAHISADLKDVCAGLAGLYLENGLDAVVLFNTNTYGHSVAHADVGLLGNLHGVFCAIGLAKCNFDCVSYCTKGCKNYIDVDAQIGAHLQGLVGLCILPKVLLVVNAAKVVVSVTVDSLLCLVGGLLKGLLGIFNCRCA